MFPQLCTRLFFGKHISSLNKEFKRQLLSNNSSEIVKFCFLYNRFPHRSVSTSSSLKEEEKCKPSYKVTFIKKNGERVQASGKEGDSLLDVVVNNNLDFDGYGACEGTLTCSTCHVILKKEDYDRLPNDPGEEEMDMLDLAYELSDTSRLGCQITLTKDLDNLEVYLPTSINDARS
ncbi:hypothetical protein V9T40_006707 [Parthenolecanium corni]|uniref:2Fe-2S ferredoxin-type domain-containing protein n=1 Tax=Parthenolecanium corni TaxID=536013 RepID=A0AAN9Y7D0_9HEMI